MGRSKSDYTKRLKTSDYIEWPSVLLACGSISNAEFFIRLYSAFKKSYKIRTIRNKLNSKICVLTKELFFTGWNHHNPASAPIFDELFNNWIKLLYQPVQWVFTSG